MVHEITQKVRKLLRKYINVPSNIFKMAKDSKLKKEEWLCGRVAGWRVLRLGAEPEISHSGS